MFRRGALTRASRRPQSAEIGEVGSSRRGVAGVGRLTACSGVPTKIGGEPPFELAIGARRISTLRAHMRFYFRVAKRAQMAELAAIYDELVAEPFAWLKQTGYVAATAPAL